MLSTCTILARNYLPQARVLARSFHDLHPGSRFVALLVDDEDRGLDTSDEPFTCLRLGDVGLDEREVHRLATMYDVTELATAVKPLLLARLLRDGAGTAIYLDPDIVVYESLAPLVPLAEGHGIVLTPHTTVPLPRDERRLTSADLLAAGVFNLGFIAVGPNADEFLEWWWKQTRRDALSDISRMMFTDQRWIDFVPCLFDHVVLRETAYNVAYWNLHGRHLAWEEGRYTVDGQPLRFFHFSGYDPRRPWILSRHQGDDPRVVLSEHPAVARICGEYAARLAEARDPEIEKLPYGWGSASAGFLLTPRIRRLYRDALLEAERGDGPEPPTAFDADGLGFVRFLNAPVAPLSNPKISRYLYSLHQDRTDLRAHFRDLASDAPSFLRWVLGDGVRQEEIPGPLLPTPEETRGAAAPQTPGPEMDSAGVNVVGYFNAELGVGEAGRLLVGALEATGTPHATISYRNTRSRQQHLFEDHGIDRARFATNLLCVNADQTPGLVGEFGRTFFESRYNVGYWFWEVERFPEHMHGAFSIVDEVWVASRFVAEAVRSAGIGHVETLPLPIAVPVPEPGVTRAELGLPDRFTFLFLFDYFSVLERKNPMALIEAFSRAFAPNEGPVLVIKSINGHRRRNDLERVRMLASARPDVLLFDDYMSVGHRASLMDLCDCYVSLHRSEGLGLTMAESMALGKPVIATGYSGNVDFMTPENSYLVDYTLEAVPPGCAPYPAGTPWARPAVEHAAALMRHVHENREEAADRGRLARRHVLETFSPEACGVGIARRLADIQGGRRAMMANSRETVPGNCSVGSAAPAIDPPPPAEAPAVVSDPHVATALAASRHASTPKVQAARGLAMFKAAYQRLLYRLLQPLWHQQRHAHELLATAVERLELSVAERRAADQALEADVRALSSLAAAQARGWHREFDAVNARVRDERPAIDAIASSLEALKTRITAVESRATGDREFTDLAARVAAIERDVERHARAMADLEDGLGEQSGILAAHVDASQAETNALRARLDSDPVRR